MSRKDLVGCMWLTWSVFFLGLPVALFMAIAAGYDGHPYAKSTFLELLLAFACDAAIALVLTGILLEQDGKLLSIRFAWVVPLFWVGGLAGGWDVAYTVRNSGPLAGVAGWAAGLLLPAAIALSASWVTRLKHTRRPVVV